MFTLDSLSFQLCCLVKNDRCSYLFPKDKIKMD